MMRCRRCPWFIAAALLACGALSTAEAPLPFVIALVRDDGVMLPVATHDRGRWRMPWPGPAKEADVPVRLEDCPLAWWGLPVAPVAWTLHVPGEPPRPVTVDRPTWVRSYCRQQVALHSRAASRPLLRMASGARVPKYGVAVAGPGQVRLPRSVAPDSSEGQALLDHLQTTFNREEQVMLAVDYFAVHQPSLDAATRARLPIRPLSMHAGPGRDGGTYFVELTRAYPRRQPARLRWCDEVTYLAGWVRRRHDRSLDLTPVTRAVTSCLLDTAQRAHPLAVVETPGGPVWMLELYRPDMEMVGMFLAPAGDVPEPLVMREIGRCANRRTPGLAGMADP